MKHSSRNGPICAAPSATEDELRPFDDRSMMSLMKAQEPFAFVAHGTVIWYQATGWRHFDLYYYQQHGHGDATTWRCTF